MILKYLSSDDSNDYDNHEQLEDEIEIVETFFGLGYNFSCDKTATTVHGQEYFWHEKTTIMLNIMKAHYDCEFVRQQNLQSLLKEVQEELELTDEEVNHLLDN